MWEPLTVHSAWAVWSGVVALLGTTAFTLWARVALGTMWTSSAVVNNGITYHRIRGGDFETSAQGISCEFEFNLAQPSFASSFGASPSHFSSDIGIFPACLWNASQRKSGGRLRPSTIGTTSTQSFQTSRGRRR